MDIFIQLTNSPIAQNQWPPGSGLTGARAEFHGLVRGEENGAPISALEYEAYPAMAEREIRRLLEELAARHACFAITVIHRLGLVPVGEAAIFLRVTAKHRGPAFALLAEFMDRLKQDVPIWKRRAIPAATGVRLPSYGSLTNGAHRAPLESREALAAIRSRCPPLPAVRIPLAEARDRVLREAVLAAEDAPACDRSTRDGYAVLQDDPAAEFVIRDTLHAADWKPRPLQPGEAVRVATGAALPCAHLRVVMLEHVEHAGDRLRILHRDDTPNVRHRGEELKAGEPLLCAGQRLTAGDLAALASAGCVRPAVNPRLRVHHFTTGDEIVPPEQPPGPGQIRDSNSILLHALLAAVPCDLTQQHLPEDMAAAMRILSRCQSQLATTDLILFSGGASVGDLDFTRPLLEWLGFEIVFDRLNLRPGAPLIFGTRGNRLAFGLPGNPLSHWVCFHLFVTAALAGLSGTETKPVLRGVLAAPLETAPHPRETWWPARLQLESGRCELTPLRWNSSGDVTVLTKSNALLRILPACGRLPAGAEVEFLPTEP